MRCGPGFSPAKKAL
jgi:hypothetical protein